jgi:hypothetical protein
MQRRPTPQEWFIAALLVPFVFAAAVPWWWIIDIIMTM